MFTPVSISVSGFRGFRQEQRFDLSHPVTELVGPNRGGKSSLLNAIEWALFGDDCAGKQTGIRERVGWVIANRHMTSPQVRVRLELEGPGGTFTIVRSLSKHPRKQAWQESLELTLHDANVLTDSAAVERQAALLQSSFRDFSCAVYQHQEAIRAILTQEPKERNDAIDRLLGLSDHRNLIAALEAADLPGRQRAMAKDFSAFEERVRVCLAARERDLAVLRHQAQEAGLEANQLTGNAALAATKKAARALCGFCAEAALEFDELPLPREWTDLDDFDQATRQSIGQLRGRVPGVAEQENLIKARRQLLGVKVALDENRKVAAGLAAKALDLDRRHAGRQAVDAAIADANEKLRAEQAELRRVNGRAAVVREAMTFLETLGDEQAACPVCEKPATGLAGTVKELWSNQLNMLVEGVTFRIDALKQRDAELRSVARQYQELADQAEQCCGQEALLRDQTATLMGERFSENDDPLAAIALELGRFDERLKKLAEAIDQRQKRLDAIERDLGLTRLVYNYLRQQEKKQALDRLQESAEFEKLEAIRDQVAQLVEDQLTIKNAIAHVARDEAATKIASAETTIDDYFRQLSRNPAVGRLRLTVNTDKRTGRNHYEITDDDANDLTPILSQGDLNALALAIFLGLATASSETGPFGFVMLDDPSQSLASEHKEQLARVLNQVARHKRVIVATMDAELHEQLEARLTKNKQLYQFGEWTPEAGPTVIGPAVIGPAVIGPAVTDRAAHASDNGTDAGSEPAVGGRGLVRTGGS